MENVFIPVDVRQLSCMFHHPSTCPTPSSSLHLHKGLAVMKDKSLFEVKSRQTRFHQLLSTLIKCSHAKFEMWKLDSNWKLTYTHTHKQTLPQNPKHKVSLLTLSNSETLNLKRHLHKYSIRININIKILSAIVDRTDYPAPNARAPQPIHPQPKHIVDWIFPFTQWISPVKSNISCVHVLVLCVWVPLKEPKNITYRGVMIRRRRECTTNTISRFTGTLNPISVFHLVVLLLLAMATYKYFCFSLSWFVFPFA